MPPRIPAANELIADKRCYTQHVVLLTTGGQPAAPPAARRHEPLAGGGGQDPDPAPWASPQLKPLRGRAKTGLCLLGARTPILPARHRSLRKSRQGWPLFPTWKTAREGKREGGTLEEGVDPPNGPLC